MTTKPPKTYKPGEARRYARLVRRPLDVLLNLADALKLTDTELGKVARAYRAAVARRAEAPEIVHPFLDTCLTEALAAANGTGPIVPQPLTKETP